MYERWDSDQKLATQYWTKKNILGADGQNSYWIAYPTCARTVTC